MTKKLIWRLGTLPTPTELTLLVDKELITKAEAREILITEKEITERDSDSFKEEIKFLREIIEKLSKPQVVKEYIQSSPVIIHQYPWMQPYVTWGVNNNKIYCATNGTITSGGNNLQNETINCSFTSIETF